MNIQGYIIKLTIHKSGCQRFKSDDFLVVWEVVIIGTIHVAVSYTHLGYALPHIAGHVAAKLDSDWLSNFLISLM